MINREASVQTLEADRLPAAHRCRIQPTKNHVILGVVVVNYTR